MSTSPQLPSNIKALPALIKQQMLERLQGMQPVRASGSTELRLNLRTPHVKQQPFIDSTAKRKVIRAGRRGGKAQPLTAKVYTPTGPRLMGTIRIGEIVLTPAGGVAKVEGIFPQGVVDIYAVQFGDGTVAECTADHLWEIEERRTDSKWRQRTRVVDTGTLSRMATVKQSGRGANRRPTIPQTKPAAYCGQPLPLDPYLLGVLIGDGTMMHESVGLSSGDEHILDEVRRRLPSGVSVRRDRQSCDYRLSVGVGVHFNPVIRTLKHLGLWGKYSYEKFIPDIYKYNSTEVRLQVLRGLLDTDGWVDHNGQPRFEQTSERLAADFAETVQSLGGLCTLKTKMGGYRVPGGERKETRTVYRQVVLCEDARNLFTLPAKKIKARPRAYPVRRHIQSVKFVRRAEAQCIKLSDERGLYLTDSLIATHNTVGIAIDAVKRFAAGRRVLYAAPTQDQVDRFWYEVKKALEVETDAGRLYKNETKHIIERPGTEQRIRAKTAWNPDTLRGDYADYLILDEWQLMDEDTWKLVGAPMLLDNNGDAVFIYTPPSRRARSTSKASDKMHAAKLYKRRKAEQELAEKNGTESRWATFHFSSLDNPYISEEALADITSDMTRLDYEQEILAIDKEDNPGALWTSEQIEKLRVTQTPERFERIVISVDPSATSGGDEAGIIAAGVGMCGCKGEGVLERHGFILEDATLQGSPHVWASAAVAVYNKLKADRMVAESNNGGEMVSLTIGTIQGAPPVKLIHASRGKQTRAEPVAALYEQHRVHHVGTFSRLEDEMTQWDPSMTESPNRMDAMVWAMTELAIQAGWDYWA